MLRCLPLRFAKAHEAWLRQTRLVPYRSSSFTLLTWADQGAESAASLPQLILDGLRRAPEGLSDGRRALVLEVRENNTHPHSGWQAPKRTDDVDGVRVPLGLSRFRRQKAETVKLHPESLTLPCGEANRDRPQPRPRGTTQVAGVFPF